MSATTITKAIITFDPTLNDAEFRWNVLMDAYRREGLQPESDEPCMVQGTVEYYDMVPIEESI